MLFNLLLVICCVLIIVCFIVGMFSSGEDLEIKPKRDWTPDALWYAATIQEYPDRKDI